MNFDLAQKQKFPEHCLFSLANPCSEAAEVVLGAEPMLCGSKHQM
jgi:hypothetical protein